MRFLDDPRKARAAFPGLTDGQHRQHLDDLLVHYVRWRDASGSLAAAYDYWKRAGRQDRKLAFSQYIAALNCEEEAARLYQQAAERLAAESPNTTPR
jgi:hypothetical protein